MRIMYFFVMGFSLMVVTDAYSEDMRNQAIEYYKSKGKYVLEIGEGSPSLSLPCQSKKVTDDDLKYVPYFPEIEIIHLGGCGNITDEGLKYLSSSYKLNTLTLERVKITDKGIEYLSKLENIDTLVLKETKITDKSLKIIGKMIKLMELNLMGTNITDAGLKHLENLKSLRMLLLRGTKVTAKGIQQLKKKLPDTYITLETEEQVH